MANTLNPLETRLLIWCVYWRTRAAGITLYRDLPPILLGVLQDTKCPQISTDEEALAIIKEIQLHMLFDTPAIPEPVTMTDF